MVNMTSKEQRGEQTKYSAVLPDGSFTPPPKMVDEVLWTCWGVEDLVAAAEESAPPLRTVLPCSHPPARVVMVVVKR